MDVFPTRLPAYPPFVAGLCSNADKLDARATDPKTRPWSTHPSRRGTPRQISQQFRVSSPPPRSGSAFAPMTAEAVALFGAAKAALI
jgi:hypothetical protein